MRKSFTALPFRSDEHSNTDTQGKPVLPWADVAGLQAKRLAFGNASVPKTGFDLKNSTTSKRASEGNPREGTTSQKR